MKEQKDSGKTFGKDLKDSRNLKTTSYFFLQMIKIECLYGEQNKDADNSFCWVTLFGRLLKTAGRVVLAFVAL